MWLSYLNLAVIVVGVPLAVVLAIVASYFVPARYWLRIEAVAATLQGYTINVAGIFPSVSLLAALGAWRSALTCRDIYRVNWMRWLLALLAMQLAAIGWSPEPFAAIRNVIFALPILTLCAAMYGYARQDGEGAMRVMEWALRIAVIVPVLVVVFRLFPSIEARFYGLRAAMFLISPNILSSLFDEGGGNNVIAADKAGGLFINANTASVYLGVCAFLSWGLAKATQHRSLRLLAIIFWGGVFFTGSKAGVIAAVLIAALAWLGRIVRVRRIGLGAAIGFCVVGSAFSIIMPFVMAAYRDSGFTEASISTLQSREIIWDFARRMVKEHPILGLGHGGWEQYFAFYSYANGFRNVMPPHNAFLILWSQGGVFLAFAGVGFIVSLAWWCGRYFWHADPKVAALSEGLLWAFAWYVFQSQGENYGLAGEFHLTPLLGMAMGLTLAYVGVPSKKGLRLDQCAPCSKTVTGVCRSTKSMEVMPNTVRLTAGT